MRYKSETLWCPVWLPALLLLATGVHARGQDGALANSPDEQAGFRAARRQAMMKVAQSLTVMRQQVRGPQTCQLVEHSVLNWTDEVYHSNFGEGSMWVWHDEGLPQAVAQVFADKQSPRWTIGFNSISSDHLRIDDGELARTLRPTLYRPQNIPNAPPPAKTVAARTVQLKQLAQRFEAFNIPTTRFDPDQKTIHLRLLSRPLHRYASPAAGVLDGAIFGFVHGGTNVQITMMIDARQQPDTTTAWTVGFGRLDLGENFAQLDGRDFWREPACPEPRLPDWPSNYFFREQPWQ